MATNFQWKQTISMPIQIAAMAALPNFYLSRRVGRTRAIWIGKVAPTEMSEVYTIKIDYELGSVPKVWVLSPELHNLSSKNRIPHLYREGCLCLYFPWANEWTSNMLISHTIVGWASLWLYYYEIWLTTTKWQGGGIHIIRQQFKKKGAA